MKITVNLSKVELDLIEDALVHYSNLLMKSENRDDMVDVEYELQLCKRIFEEFGMEAEFELENLQQELKQNQIPPTSMPNQYPFSR
ncbi:hypothetical protein [Thermoflavimicrobium dichotomicum]|uniref:Uncharacterized protein n=1 Tax=Thermoflavimicrobium dichotomicum TaxID=46223 RepID=A0A1I3MYA1_9BACL|nr:hypothetical protein [Thermoflavimicrobium dichotomicum]SFJ01636.1 hypothetical protein SAMN05421852_103242 [Thermoflavimicrobium dichotomicum]